MKIIFLHSKEMEKENLLNIYDEYQWFIDNDFPIVLPKFYAAIYQKNKTRFTKDLNNELEKIYNEKKYQLKSELAKKNWQEIEKEVFNILNAFNFKVEDRYTCYISLYGPEGQFQYPNIVNLRVTNNQDLEHANEVICHELIHLLIFNKVKELGLNYRQIEGMVDLFFTETKFKIMFPKYKQQSIGIHDKQSFIKILNSLA